MLQFLGEKETRKMERSTMKAKNNEKIMPIAISDRKEFYRLKIQELEEEEAEQNAEKESLMAQKIAELKALGFEIPEAEVNQKNGSETLEVAPEVIYHGDYKPWYHISSQQGLFILLGVFASTVLAFAWYGFFFPLNDSELRITNAAGLHFLSHIWLSVAVLCLGFGFQFLAFNDHFRYLWSNCETEYTAKDDFWSPDSAGKVRLIGAFFSWAFPVYIITQMFQLILG